MRVSNVGISVSVADWFSAAYKARWTVFLDNYPTNCRFFLFSSTKILSETVGVMSESHDMFL